MLNKGIKFLIENKLVAVLLLALFLGMGAINAPFNWDTGFLPSNPVAVDAIPDIGENQQIVYTEWAGRSPQDIEDQISYPDRKSTRLNSSHVRISYAVFCLKKKNKYIP